MNAKRKTQGRRASDNAVTITVDNPRDVSSVELQALLKELNKGRAVRLAKQVSERSSTEPQQMPIKEHMLKNLSFNEVVAMLGSGVALGVATLAIAPAAPVAATLAAVFGVGLGGVVHRYDKSAHTH